MKAAKSLLTTGSRGDTICSTLYKLRTNVFEVFSQPMLIIVWEAYSYLPIFGCRQIPSLALVYRGRVFVVAL